MTELDDELRKMMGRVEPPGGFAERVLRRAGKPSATETRANLPSTKSSTPAFVRWAVAAALVAAVAGGLEYRARRQEQAAGEAAREQVVQALQIAGSKLQLVQTKINRLHETGRNP
ncbi:MAG TPA: hypothetical protein VM818_20840 [Vicinamibacterales bacterium]|nr:hypothetical protein [Vicinamibacterales bacterium]